MLEPRLAKLNWLEKQIVAFEEMPPVKNKIVFYGDSAFTRWKLGKHPNPNLEEEVLMRDGTQACVNRGFGTSTSEELLYYYPRVIRPLEPRALVILAFGNDRGCSYSPIEIFSLQTRLLEYARTDFPGIKLFFCNVRPLKKHKESPKGTHIAIREYNGLVKHYCDTHEDTTYVEHEIWPGFYAEGHTGELEYLRDELFVEDAVHYNYDGYKVYADFFRVVLKDLL